VLFRKRVTRAKLLGLLAAQPPCIVAMEACAGAHHWAREIAKLGHDVRLIPPAYVQTFVKRQKNDAADAEAICEAAQRPTMRFVPVKTDTGEAGYRTSRPSRTHARPRVGLGKFPSPRA
jgi:transposase